MSKLSQKAGPPARTTPTFQDGPALPETRVERRADVDLALAATSKSADLEAAVTTTRIGFPFSGERLGGSHFSVLLLLQGLRETNCEPIVLLHQESPVAEFFRAHGFEIEIEPLAASAAWSGPAHRRLLASIRAAIPVARMILKHRLDLVHVNDHKTFQLWVFGTRLVRRPFLLHWRGVYRNSLVTRVMMSFASRVIAISRFVREHYPKAIAVRAVSLYNPFDVDLTPPEPAGARAALRQQLGLPADARILAWIGNSDARKHPEQFVAIIERLAARRKDDKLQGILCGGFGSVGDDPAYLAALERNRRVVRHLGFVDPILPLLAGCDALVVTAVDEPFGRTLIEAMLCGVPVIAAAHGGNIEAIENGRTGLLFPPGDLDVAVARIEGLLDDPAMTAAIAEAARAESREKYSARRHVQGVVAVYQEMLAGTDSAPNAIPGPTRSA